MLIPNLSLCPASSGEKWCLDLYAQMKEDNLGCNTVPCRNSSLCSSLNVAFYLEDFLPKSWCFGSFSFWFGDFVAGPKETQRTSIYRVEVVKCIDFQCSCVSTVTKSIPKHILRSSKKCCFLKFRVQWWNNFL